MNKLATSGMSETSVLRSLMASPTPVGGQQHFSFASSVFIGNWSADAKSRGFRSPDANDTFTSRNQEFIELLAAYRDSGGIARTHEVMTSLRARNGLTTEKLAGWIVAHQIINFDWQNQTWFPWFQFDQESGRPRPEVGEIVQQLCTFQDNWQIACWFVRPNAGMDDHLPLDEIGRQSLKVVAAAHSSRMSHDYPD